MPGWGWVLVGVLAAAAAMLALLLIWINRRYVAARAEADQLRTMVKKRLERPNVFSHEVRTPLTLIRAAAELLAEETPGPLTERQREFVSTIGVNAQQVIGLAEDMLAEARIEAQLFELHLERTDLRALVRTTVRDARRIHPTTILLDDHSGPITLLADPGLLAQALWNLVNNACRHSGEGARVNVAVSASEGQAIVSVSDDGGGMTAGERATLFQPFATGGARAGTGLGMMITERIISEHGGTLLVDTVEGRGTTIFFTIPTERTEVGHE